MAVVQTQRSPADFLATRVRDRGALADARRLGQGPRSSRRRASTSIDLGGGDPDFITPAHIRQAAADAMNAGDTHYVASAGTPALRKAIADKLKIDNGIEVRPRARSSSHPAASRPSSKRSLALVEPGVDVMILEPAWVSYAPMVEMAGGNVVHVGLDPDDNWRVTPRAARSRT